MEEITVILGLERNSKDGTDPLIGPSIPYDARDPEIFGHPSYISIENDPCYSSIRVLEKAMLENRQAEKYQENFMNEESVNRLKRIREIHPYWEKDFRVFNWLKNLHRHSQPPTESTSGSPFHEQDPLQTSQLLNVRYRLRPQGRRNSFFEKHEITSEDLIRLMLEDHLHRLYLRQQAVRFACVSKSSNAGILPCDLQSTQLSLAESITVTVGRRLYTESFLKSWVQHREYVVQSEISFCDKDTHVQHVQLPLHLEQFVHWLGVLPSVGVFATVLDWFYTPRNGAKCSEEAVNEKRMQMEKVFQECTKCAESWLRLHFLDSAESTGLENCSTPRSVSGVENENFLKTSRRLFLSKHCTWLLHRLVLCQTKYAVAEERCTSFNKAMRKSREKDFLIHPFHLLKAHSVALSPQEVIQALNAQTDTENKVSNSPQMWALLTDAQLCTAQKLKEELGDTNIESNQFSTSMKLNAESSGGPDLIEKDTGLKCSFDYLKERVMIEIGLNIIHMPWVVDEEWGTIFQKLCDADEYHRIHLSSDPLCEISSTRIHICSNLNPASAFSTDD